MATKLRDISAARSEPASASAVAAPPTTRASAGLADRRSSWAALSEVDIRTSIRPTVALVDLAALRANAAAVRQVAGRADLWSVIKADAYGHGAVPVARALAAESTGLAVSLVEEGLELRAAGIATPILVLGAFYGKQHDDVVAQRLTPVVANRDDLIRFAEAGARRGRPVGLHLKLDTGMSRLGVRSQELGSVLAQIKAAGTLRLAGVATHFACADGLEDDETKEQLRRFREGLEEVRRAGFSGLTIHAANSAATLRFPEARFDAVRPGLALYGASPLSATLVPSADFPSLRPVLSLRSRIMALREIPAGEGVSYGWSWRAPRPSRIGTLPIGYADGYPRHVQGAEVLVRGQRAPVVGAVCMDMLMVDLTDVAGASVDDEAMLIGRSGANEITVDDVARWAGTISYEILCGISKRVPRLYVE